MALAATNLVRLKSPSGILSDLVMYEHHLAARHRSPRTLESYRLTLEQFDRFLTDAEHTRRTEDLTRHDVTAFLADLTTRGYAPGTVQLRFNGLRAFLTWASDPEGGELIDKSPMHRMTAPRAPLTPIRTLDAEAMRKLLDTCKGKDLHDRRDSAILLLAFDSGLRRNEIGDLTVGDVETTTRTAFVRRGKGGRSRTASFGPKTAIALEKYLRVRRLNRWADSPSMWIGKTGPMAGRSLNRIFDRRCRQAGLVDAAGKPLYHPHTARHGFTDAVLQSGMHESEVQLLGGWSSRDMLARYGREHAAERARESYAKHGAPSDRI